MSTHFESQDEILFFSDSRILACVYCIIIVLGRFSLPSAFDLIGPLISIRTFLNITNTYITE